METTYFALGVLSMIAVMFVVVIVIGLVKVMRTEKNLNDLKFETRNQFGDLHRFMDSSRTDIYRSIEESKETFFRTIDEQIRECRKYTDKRVDKTLNQKED